MAELLYKLGLATSRHGWRTLIVWIVLFAIAGGGFALGYRGLTNSFDIPGTASGEVTDELFDELPDYAGASGTVVLHTTDGAEFTDEQRAEVADLVERAADLPDIAQVIDPFEAQQQLEGQVAQLEDGRAQLEAGQQQLDDGQAQLDAGQAQLDAGQQQLDAARAQAEAAGSAGAAALAQLEAQQAQLDAQQDTIDEQQAQLDAGREELEANRVQLENGAELAGFANGISTVSEDRSTAIVNVTFTETRLELAQESKDAVIAHFQDAEIDGVEADVSTDIAQGVPQIFGIGEAVGLLVAAIVLVLVLGSALAAVFPIITALLGVGVAIVGSLAFSGVVQMASVTPVLAVMLGLAVGIDYSLFIINRHRKQLLAGADVRESIGIANGTAGNAVVFAGSTVIVALLALNITGIPFLGLMGTVGAVAVLIAVLVAVTLTPALLGLAGIRLLTKRRRAHLGEHHKHVETETKPMPTWRAVLTAVLSVAVLLVVAIPTLSMRVGLPDGSSEPEDSTSYRAYELTTEQFGEGVTGPLLVTADLPEGLDDAGILQAQVDVARVLADQNDVVALAPIDVSEDGTLTAFQIVPEEGPNSVSTAELVDDLRALEPVDGDIALGVAGQAASNIDISDNLNAVLPIYLAVVVGISLVLLIAVFRSLLVPLIATGGFVLSLFATYGATVAVFQWGWLGDVFGITTPGPILSFLPVILVGILFGLAMDYQLFLASGMREAFVHGSPAKRAVMEGLKAGRVVVVAAGLIMVAVFGGFVFSESIIIRSMGFGLAFGVLVDAFVVRLLLMPALMHLLGRSAWWLPKWLDRILPNVDVEGARLERRHHLTTTAE